MPLDQAQKTNASTVSESITVAAWDAGAEKELKKIPFFVRGKARRNTERYATERGISVITTETLYESKAHFSQS
jgi:light-independent protochlorophyllide reductase subunit B